MCAMPSPETAVVVGVGPGLGLALVRCFAGAGMQVVAAARNAERAAALLAGTGARTHACDATDEVAVGALFARIAGETAAPALVVHNPSHFVMKPVLDLTREDFVEAWRVACLGGFLVGRAAARAMLKEGRGTILFTGSTPSVKAGAEFAAFAAAKFGVRALAQSMARELGPNGIHIAHVVVDGPIDAPDNAALKMPKLSPANIAEAFLALHRQPRSAWTQELDLRPAGAKF
jgi:NAD(P)-dependent dehydrogenase (short-subunit alcohol dehydrogenase family)